MIRDLRAQVAPACTVTGGAVENMIFREAECPVEPVHAEGGIDAIEAGRRSGTVGAFCGLLTAWGLTAGRVRIEVEDVHRRDNHGRCHCRSREMVSQFRPPPRKRPAYPLMASTAFLRTHQLPKGL